MLYFDTSTDYTQNIIRNVTIPKFQVGIFYSGVPRSLRNSSYNLRVSECTLAAKILKNHADIPKKPNFNDYLREIPEDIFEQHKSHLPDNLRKRAEHYFSEQARVIEGIAAWQSGEINKFGQLIFDSGDSSKETTKMDLWNFVSFITLPRIHTAFMEDSLQELGLVAAIWQLLILTTHSKLKIVLL